MAKEPKPKKLLKLSPEMKEVEKTISMQLGSKVKIVNKKNNSGKIEINYTSMDDLERIMDLLGR